MTGSVSMMDKNKSAHKFKGVPHIYWINLDTDNERRQYMEEQFEYWEIKNHTRISGYDGREDDVTEHLKGKFPDFMNMNEVACCMSHLKALKKFYYETEDEYCIIAEDDVDLHIAKYWSFSWVEFFALLPHDWDDFFSFYAGASNSIKRCLSIKGIKNSFNHDSINSGLN